MANCEFCGRFVDVANTAYPTRVGLIEFHTECFKTAIKILADNKRDQLKSSVKIIPESPAQYMIIMDPDETLKSAPREHYKTYKQAATVAKRLTIETGKTFWVMKHVASTSL